MKLALKPLALILATAFCHTTFAQGIATEQQVQSVAIEGKRSPLAANLPATTASLTVEQLRLQQNIFNPEDVLLNMPNTTIRKRYSGDRNALIGGRSFSSTQAPRGLVLLDGYLISNFLGRFDAPRWNMIAPEEIERVDMLFGPFSAIYPGNSIGSTIIVSTRKPKTFEASARFALQRENFDSYGQHEKLTNMQSSIQIGDKLPNGIWYRFMANHQDSTGHPMQYYSVNANDAGVFAKPAGTKSTTAVTGVIYDIAPTGQKRAVFGANAGAIDHTLQNTVKAQFGYDFSNNLTAEGMLAWWNNDSATRNSSQMRDATGQTIWSGRVSNNGNVWDIPTTAFAPFNRNEAHLQSGVTLKTRYSSGWNFSLVASQYQILEDLQRNANNPDPVAALGGAGTSTTREGTHFRTLELQSTYKPIAGQHYLSLCLHANTYHLQQQVQNIVSDWRTNSGVDSQKVAGDTRLFALYGQDAWNFAPSWKATLGARWESWNADDGFQQFTPGATQNYAARHLTTFSPKAALTWDAMDEVTLRLSAGRGTRFATVAELFQGSQSGSSIVVNDPHLRPERSDAFEFMLEKRFNNANLRVSIFQDKIRDTIWSQTNLTVFPNITNVQNVDLVNTRGIELAGDMDHFFIAGLSLNGNLALNHATILENKNFPGSVGKEWVRIPRVRASIGVNYMVNSVWNLATTLRYVGRQYTDMMNLDSYPDTYGGVSRVKQIDLRAVYMPSKNWQLAMGIDNVLDYRAYQYHPLPGRNLFAEIRYIF
ncbi:MAG: TonB-dependent receptor [Undibacterium sp.]|nr:TonB-dependent receptor [Undibacterium sp.]